jgi:hypothetical protein
MGLQPLSCAPTASSGCAEQPSPVTWQWGRNRPVPRLRTLSALPQARTGASASGRSPALVDPSSPPRMPNRAPRTRGRWTRTSTPLSPDAMRTGSNLRRSAIAARRRSPAGGDTFPAGYEAATHWIGLRGPNGDRIGILEPHTAIQHRPQPDARNRSPMGISPNQRDLDCPADPTATVL